MADDVIQVQRLASGYIPGLSEAGHPGAGQFFGTGAGNSPTSAQLQNCTAARPPGTPVGVYDILLPAGGMSAVGLGGPLASAFPNPPLVVAPVSPAGQIVQQGRVKVTARAHLNAAIPPVAGDTSPVFHSVLYGATLAPAPVIYPGFANSQIVRIYITNVAGLADADFDFEIERVLDPSVEP